MFERFTGQARAAVAAAQDVARGLGHTYIGTEHLLLGLLAQPASLPAALLGQRGVDRAAIEAELLRWLGPGHGTKQLDADALGSIGIDLTAVQERVEAAFGKGALDRPPVQCRTGRVVSGRHIPFTPRAKKVLELSLREALRLDHKYIGAGHILLGILREGDGLAAQLLAAHRVDFSELRKELDHQIPRTSPD